MQALKPPFHVMIKPRGPVCNQACDYCYYLPKANLYPNTDFRMSLELLADFTHQMISAHPGGEVTFAWQGGEPTLMGLDFFKEAVRIQAQIAPAGMQIINTIQTNGSTLTPAWCQFLKDQNFLVGLSMDGPSELHNAYRHDKAGQGTFTQALRGVKLLKSYDVAFNILCCVHRANQGHPLDVYHYFRDSLEVNFIQFIPILQREQDGEGDETARLTDLSVESEAYGRFLKAVFDEWVQRDVGRVFVQIFDLALGAWLGAPPGLCVFAETCGNALVLEYNGDLYACDHFVDPEHYLGNITHQPLADMVNSTTQVQFGLAKREQVSPACLDCPVWQACHGGCPKNRDENGLNRLCPAYRTFFEHIAPSIDQMAELIRRGRAPAKIMKA